MVLSFVTQGLFLLQQCRVQHILVCNEDYISLICAAKHIQYSVMQLSSAHIKKKQRKSVSVTGVLFHSTLLR